MNVLESAQVVEHAGEQRIGLAVVERDVRRGPDDDHHARGIDMQPIEDRLVWTPLAGGMLDLDASVA